MTDWLSLAIALPLLGAVLAAALPGRGAGIGLVSGTAAALASLALTARVWDAGPLRLDIGGWGQPLGIALVADGLALPFLVMSNLVALAVSAYAAGYFRGAPAGRHFWPLWLLLWTALNALFLAGDLFNLYVTLELVGLSAAALGALGGQREAVAANLRYLLVGLFGSMIYLLGVTLIYTGFGVLDLKLAAAALVPGPVAAVAFALMTGGLLLKAALFPMHFWLPPAHANAPAPVSAALSALVVKAAVYLVLRLWLDLFGPVAGPAAGTLLGLLGAGAVLWGSWNAFRAERLKLLAAYSTVAQIGYLFLFFPLLAALPPGPGRDTLVGALVLLALSHGFAKSGFFLAAGLLQRAAGHDRVAALGPVAQDLPAASFAIGVAGLALVGLPPSGTFLAKWLLMAAAIETGQWWWVPIVIAGTLLAAAYMFRLVSVAFAVGGAAGGIEPHGRGDLPAQAPALLLTAVAGPVLGLAAAPLWDLIAVGRG